jgi:glycosyltransferase involved in cell wall biosynthesis
VKVLHLINTLSAGGAELHLLTLCRHLKRMGIDLQVACLREEVKGSRSIRSDFENENIGVTKLDADNRYNLSFLRRLLRLIENEKPDILHTHLPRADIAGAVAVCMAGSSALLCSVHGIYKDRWFGSWAAPFMRGAYRKAEAVIAISGAVKDWLCVDLRVDDDKVSVIHYGIEPECFKSSNNGVETYKPVGGLVIGSIGRLEPSKGFDCLIRAMQIVHKQIPGASLLIAGHDPLGYGETLQGLIAELKLNEQVRLIGFQKNVSAFLNAVNVFAFASRSEGFGQVIIEAMAAGKPVVTNRIAPFTEIVEDRVTGFLAEPCDSQSFAAIMLWLLAHPKEAADLGKQGQKRVQSHFSARSMAQETLSLYEALLRAH